MIVIYTHIKAWIKKPGYPEGIATATGSNKLTFAQSEMRAISYNLK